MLRSKVHSVANSAKIAFANCGPLSVHIDLGIIPCSANISFMIDIVFAELHWEAGILQMIGILG